MTRSILAALLLLLLGILAGTLYETGNVRRAEAVADSIGREVVFHRRVADREKAALQDSIALAADRVREAEEKAERAERRLAWQQHETAALTVVVNETNVGCPPEHIRADSLLALSNAAEKVALLDMLDAMQAERDAWEMQSRATARVLEARELECETCRQEAEAWQRAANPGWFTRLRQSLPGMGLTALATVVLVLAL